MVIELKKSHKLRNKNLQNKPGLRWYNSLIWWYNFLLYQINLNLLQSVSLLSSVKKSTDLDHLKIELFSSWLQKFWYNWQLYHYFIPTLSLIVVWKFLKFGIIAFILHLKYGIIKKNRPPQKWTFLFLTSKVLI